MRFSKSSAIPGLFSTFSIVAADPAAGQVGVAVLTRSFAVGAIVPWVRAGVGAVATQAVTLSSYGKQILDALENGLSPEAALAETLAKDPQSSDRQVGVVSAEGKAANHTGEDCLDWAGGRTGENFTVQGNILVGEGVLDNMVRAFQDTPGFLPERLLIALEAGQAAGGDRRGQQSAALIVEQSGYSETNPIGIDLMVDLRVDDHPDPIIELRRLYGIWQKRYSIQEAMLPYNNKEYQKAVDLMLAANQRYPDDSLILYNLACFESLAGDLEASLGHFRQAITQDEAYRDLARKDSDFDPLRGTPEFEELMST
jgi:uncharacterized Ntn-hydrolase superfamily protein